jgi:hypothetical protein
VLVNGELTKTAKSSKENTQKEITLKEQNTADKNQEEMSIIKDFDFAISLKEKEVSN